MNDVLSPETLRMLRAAGDADSLFAAMAAARRDVARAEHARRVEELKLRQARDGRNRA